MVFRSLAQVHTTIVYGAGQFTYGQSYDLRMRSPEKEP